MASDACPDACADAKRMDELTHAVARLSDLVSQLSAASERHAAQLLSLEGRVPKEATHVDEGRCTLQSGTDSSLVVKDANQPTSIPTGDLEPVVDSVQDEICPAAAPSSDQIVIPITVDNSQVRQDDEKKFGGSPLLDCTNVHAWAIACATRRDRSFAGTLLVMIFTIGFIAFQIALLGGTMMESSFPRCTNHTQCRDGEWCSPSLMGEPTTDPGVCFDCWSSYHMYNGFFLNATFDTYPDSYEKMAIAAGGDWLHAGVAHCDRTDTLPRLCDFLQTNRRAVSGVNFFVLVSVAIFLMVPMIDDMVEANFVDLVMHRRTPWIVDWKRRWAIVAVWWLNVRLRLFVLPVFTVGATAGLILSGPMHSYDLLLNGVAITFVMTLDDTLGALCIQYKDEEGDTVDPSATEPYHEWLFHRFYTALLGLSLIVTVLEAESLMPWFGNEVKHGRACSDIREVATGISLWITIAMSIIRALYHHGDAIFARRWSFTHAALAFDCVVTPLIVWRVVRMSAGQYALLYGQAGMALPYSVLSGA